uniref:Threonylcarbamoyl-AMP synthase n=1 Tax=Graphocephala atropunctata TaxID=36148 RepID=A0A1B6KWG5_9HEMI
MWLRLVKNEWSKKLVSGNHMSMLSNLPDKMSSGNVVQLRGNDSVAVSLAANCLSNGDIIAIPTDTVYGLAVDASNSFAVASLYSVKGRDVSKPLAICVKNVSEVDKWGVTKDLPAGLLKSLLPGPVTVLLNRKAGLNPDLNPGVKKVGIRVPGMTYPFIHLVTAALGRPLALTSANLSNEPNCIYPEEFRVLWPKLGAVFVTSVEQLEETNKSREGSTIVDLSVVGEFTITRRGIAYSQTLETLQKFGLAENI